MPNNVIEIVPIVFNVEMGNRCLQKILKKAKQNKKTTTLLVKN